MEQKNTEQLNDKAFVRLVATSIFSVLVCLVCLCSTTYAWFMGSVSSGANQIMAGNPCQLTVTVLQGNVGQGSFPLTAGESSDPVELSSGEYTVTLSLPEGSGSGYCKITVGGKDYYTASIERHENETPQTLTFTLIVEEPKEVTFTACWGIYSGDSDVVNGKLTIGTGSTENQ